MGVGGWEDFCFGGWRGCGVRVGRPPLLNFNAVVFQFRVAELIYAMHIKDNPNPGTWSNPHKPATSSGFRV